MRDATPVTSSKVRTIVLCAMDNCDLKIIWNRAKHRYGSIGRVRADKRSPSGPEIRGMVLYRLEKRQEAAIAAYNPTRWTSRFTI